jgi:hypothetical protein
MTLRLLICISKIIFITACILIAGNWKWDFELSQLNEIKMNDNREIFEVPGVYEKRIIFCGQLAGINLDS